MRIIFAGTPQFAADHLSYLLEQRGQAASDYQLVAVYTQPDRRAGRGKKLVPSPVKQIALQHDIPLFQPATLKDSASLSELESLNADVMIVAAYGLLLPSAVLNAPRLGCINIHASLLPRWRGAAPVERSIIAGDSETGITIMQMDEGLDTGDMLLKDSCSIESGDTGDSLREKLAQIGKPLLIRALQLINTSQLQAEKQDDRQSNYAPKLDKREGEIDWRESATLIDRKIRAFTSALSSFSTLNGERLRVTRASVCRDPHAGTSAPGEIIDVTPGGLKVSCACAVASRAAGESTHNDGDLRSILLIEEVQIPGKMPMSIKALLNGRPDLFSMGDQFNLPASPEAIC